MMATTEAEIQDQINAMYNKFWHSPYEGKIPEGLINKFREAIMMQTAKSLPAAAVQLRELIEKKDYDLEFFHVGIILNTLFNTPLNAIFFSPEQAMDSLMEYKEIEIEYNKIVERKSKEIERARAKKLEICGFTKTANFTELPRKN